MREYRYHKISPKFWTDEKVLRWSDDTRLLALYLLTCPHRTTEGLFRLPKEYICADLRWSNERLRKPFAQLLADGFIAYDEAVSVILLKHALKYQAPENPNQRTAAVRAVQELPETPLLAEFQRLAERFNEPLAEALRDAFGQPPTPSPSPSPTPSPTPEETRAADAAPVPLPDPETPSNPDDVQPDGGPGFTEAFERFYSLYPRRVGKAAAFRAWKRLLKRSRDNPNPPTEEQLVAAARHYQKAMTLQERPVDRIKHPSTFLSLRDRWWEEWVNGIPDGEQPATFRGEDALDRRLREVGLA